MMIRLIADAGIPAGNASVDPRGLRDFAAEAERSGFDGISLGNRTRDATELASFVLHNTSELLVVAGHEAGSVPVDVAAHRLAVLDALSSGRLVIALAETRGQNHEERQACLDEYLVLLKRLWSNDRPFDHEGRYHRLAGAFSAAKPCRGSVPIVLGGRSGLAMKVAARHADIISLAPAPLANTGAAVERLRQLAATYRHAETTRIAMPFHVADGNTTAEIANPRERFLPAEAPVKIALAILNYHDCGVCDFVIHGLTSAADRARFGSEVIPLVRNAARHRAIHLDGVAEPFGRTECAHEWRGRY